MENKIVFTKTLYTHPNDHTLDLEVKEGTEYSLDDTNYIPVKVNNSRIAGTIFISANTVIDLGYAKVVIN